jgi:lysyl-tRNA synthetase class 2
VEDVNQLIRERWRKLEELRRIGIDPYGSRWEVSALAGELQQRYRETPVTVLETEPVSVSLAGRVMTLRDHGKATFAHLQDRSGQVQIYANFPYGFKDFVS